MTDIPGYLGVINIKYRLGEGKKWEQGPGNTKYRHFMFLVTRHSKRGHFVRN